MNPNRTLQNDGEWPSIVAIVGPTGVGKSALALRVAERFGAAIISADSRQVYRYMDIGTAKPDRTEQLRVEHFMIDLVAPSEPYSAQRFREEGTSVLRRIRAQNRLAIVVGGTGFYLRALLDRQGFAAVAPDPDLRERFRIQARDAGPEVLHAELARLDPTSATRIHPNNVPRVIRALEIVYKTGSPVPKLFPGDGVPALWLGLGADRPLLDAVVDRRVLTQMDRGLLEETRLLLAMGYDRTLPAMQGFGYAQMTAHLFGELSLEGAVAAYQQATRQYIRRQLTWFRADPRIRWLSANTDVTFRALEEIERWLGTWRP